MHWVSRRIALWIEAHKHQHNDSEEMIDIYAYGVEVVLSFFLTLTSIMLVSILTRQYECTVAFLFSFVLLRLFCDGYHAKKYWQCLLLTNILHGIVLILANHFNKAVDQKTIVICIVIISMIIINLAPVKTTQKIITTIQRYRLRAVSSGILAAIINNVILGYSLGSSRTNIAILVSLTEVMILMIYPKMKLKSHTIEA